MFGGGDIVLYVGMFLSVFDNRLQKRGDDNREDFIKSTAFSN